MVIAKKPLVNKDSVNLTNTIINKGGTSPKEQIYEENKNIKITPLGGVLEPRNVTITPDNVGKTYVVNIGKDKPSSKTSNNIGRVTVTTKHIGHKFGEYAISKIPAVYKRNSKNK